MRKTLVHALIACALGVALGLLSDGARAANVEITEPREATQYEIDLEYKATMLCRVQHQPCHLPDASCGDRAEGDKVCRTRREKLR